jgi:superfamily II RNA helicase
MSFELIFPHYNLANKTHSKLRKKCLLDSIHKYISEYFHEMTKISITQKSFLKDIEKNGWPEVFDVNLCLFPKIDNDDKNHHKLKIDTTNEKSNNLKNEFDTFEDGDNNISNIINKLKSSLFYENQIAHLQTIPMNKAIFAPVFSTKNENLRNRVEQILGISKFYKHQADAIKAIRDGKSVVVSTATSSGKSIIYNIPVMEAILDDKKTTALYLFPTKVLKFII